MDFKSAMEAEQTESELMSRLFEVVDFAAFTAPGEGEEFWILRVERQGNKVNFAGRTRVDALRLAVRGLNGKIWSPVDIGGCREYITRVMMGRARNGDKELRVKMYAGLLHSMLDEIEASRNGRL